MENRNYVMKALGGPFPEEDERGVSRLVHDLRTPLTSILGFSTSLLRDDVIWSEDEKKEFLELIVAEATHLSELRENLPGRVCVRFDKIAV